MTGPSAAHSQDGSAPRTLPRVAFRSAETDTQPGGSTERADHSPLSRVSGTEPLISGTRSTTVNLDKVILRRFSVSRELWSPEFWLRNELVRGRQVQALPVRRKRLRGDPGIHR